MIQVTGPDWPTTRALRDALRDVPETGTIRWGSTPCNKLEALRKLSEAGLNVPEFTVKQTEALDWIKQGLYTWGRRLRHSHGTDIAISAIRNVISRHGHLLIRPNPRWYNSEWWVRVIPDVAYEARAHVWGGKCFRLGIKQFKGVPKGRPEKKCHEVRSDLNGWELCYAQTVFDQYTTEDSRRTLRRTAVAACDALGVTGGAVDLLVDNRGRIFVLEVNTAPALGENSLQAWVDRIRVVAGRAMPKEA